MSYSNYNGAGSHVGFCTGRGGSMGKVFPTAREGRRDAVQNEKRQSEGSSRLDFNGGESSTYLSY